MGFWDELERGEAVKAEPGEPSSQNAPARCLECDVVSQDVMLGTCAACCYGWDR